MRSTLTMETSDVKTALRKKGPRPYGAEYLEQEQINTSGPPDNFGRIPGVDLRKNIFDLVSRKCDERIDLSGQKLSELSHAIIIQAENISTPPLPISVSKFILRDNLLRSIDPLVVRSFTCLRYLDAGRNRLEELPMELAESSIQVMILDHNFLTSDHISKLFQHEPSMSTPKRVFEHLHQIDLSSNKLVTIPKELYNCSSLIKLLLSFNKIKNLSEWPNEGLNALETLDLSNNRLENISNFPQQCLASSPSLTTLLLQNNDIHSIPYELGLLTSLRHLNMKGNPQKAVRANILEKSCGEILAYLRAKIVRK